MLKTASKIALVSLLAASPAALFAQTGQQAQPPAAGQGEPRTDEARTEPIDGQIVVQREDTILTGELLGATVYTIDGESVGDISDLVVARDGTVEGVVLGVGGFLGIGEKAIAFRLDKLNWSTVPGGADRLVLNASMEELQMAPSFKTVEQQRAEKEAERAREEALRQQQQGTTPSQ